MVKKWSREMFYISCNYACFISFLVKILLAKLKNLNEKVEKIVVLPSQV